MKNSKQIFPCIALSVVSLLCVLTSCTPEAKWEIEDVAIQMDIKTVSAGFIECSFSTTKEAYYMIAIQPAEKGYKRHMAHGLRRYGQAASDKSYPSRGILQPA
jgi:hypothetical protein